MIKNYFKVTWRNLLKSKFFSTINIFGLAIGMAVALLIGLWVYNEYTFDKFLPGLSIRLHKYDGILMPMETRSILPVLL